MFINLTEGQLFWAQTIRKNRLFFTQKNININKYSDVYKSNVWSAVLASNNPIKLGYFTHKRR